MANSELRPNSLEEFQENIPPRILGAIDYWRRSRSPGTIIPEGQFSVRLSSHFDTRQPPECRLQSRPRRQGELGRWPTPPHEKLSMLLRRMHLQWLPETG